MADETTNLTTDQVSEAFEEDKARTSQVELTDAPVVNGESERKDDESPTPATKIQRTRSSTVDAYDFDADMAVSSLSEMSFTKVKDTVHLCWDNLVWEVITNRKENTKKTILHGVSGEVAPGEVLAIMGPSGSGKTSLLRILSGLMPQTSGDIFVNGQVKKESSMMEDDTMGFKGNAAFVQQSDTLMGMLTVRQTFEIAAALKINNDNVDQNERVTEILAMLGLKSCEDTIVGSVFFNGISGGQKRRVSIGVELMNQPALIFLDEPTSGLDSNSAYQIIHIAHELAELGHTVIMTIHQPSTRMYHMMAQWDFKLLLLESGRMCYFGLVKDCVEMFRKAGYPVPSLSNPFDHYLDVINSQFQQSTVNADRIIERFSQRRLTELKQAIEVGRKKASSKELKSLNGAPWYKQVYYLLYRNTLNNLKDPAIFGVRLVMYSGLCFAIGTMYWQISKKANAIQDRISILFFVAAFLTFMSISGMPAFVEERAVFLREKINRHYSTSAYVFANMLASMPFIFIISLVCTTLIYFMINSRPGANKYGVYLANLFTALMVSESLMLAISAVSPAFMIGLAGGAGTLGLYMVVCGFFLVPSNIPAGWYWVHRGVSFHTPVFSTFMVNEFRGLKGKNDTWKGSTILETYEMDDDNISDNFWILFAMFVVYRVLFFAFLRFFNSGSKASFLHQFGIEDRVYRMIYGSPPSNNGNSNKEAGQSSSNMA